CGGQDTVSPILLMITLLTLFRDFTMAQIQIALLLDLVPAGSAALWWRTTTGASSHAWAWPGTSLVMARPRFASAADATSANREVESSYIGDHALHIERPLDWNEVVPSARLAVAQAVRANAPNANDLINASRRLPGVASISMTESTGDSSYHALQIWANRRFS